MPQDPLKIAIRGSTQEHLPVEDIANGMVLLKDGSCAMVMQLSSVNFDLLSEKEQQSLVFAYGGILNSLNFPVQILIHTSTKDISGYVQNLKIAQERQNNPLLKERIRSYRAFVEEMVKKNDVLSKFFYIVVPYMSLELGIKGGGASVLSGLTPNKRTAVAKLPYSKEYVLDKARASLEPKKDHIVRLFSRLGLEVKPLGTKDLISLFYKIYNESSSADQKVSGEEMTVPVVTTKLTTKHD